MAPVAHPVVPVPQPVMPPSPLLARDQTNEWSNVSLVPPGDEMVVKLKDGKTVKGRLAGSNDTSLTLSQKNKLVEMERRQIAKVFRTVQKHGQSNTSIGAGIGAAAGLAVGIATTTSGEESHGATAVVVVALLFAGIGALVGALFDLAPPKVLIYEAR